MATTHRRTGGGLNSSSGGELKLYLKGKRNTVTRSARGHTKGAQPTTMEINFGFLGHTVAMFKKLFLLTF